MASDWKREAAYEIYDARLKGVVVSGDIIAILDRHCPPAPDCQALADAVVAALGRYTGCVSEQKTMRRHVLAALESAMGGKGGGQWAFARKAFSP